MEDLFHRNLVNVLVNIFLCLEPGDLHTCRQVCKGWNEFILWELWSRKHTRQVLERRLKHNWRQGNFSRRSYKLKDVNHSCGVHVTDKFFILYPQVHLEIPESRITLCDIKTGNKIKETTLLFKNGIGRVDGSKQFIVFRDSESSCKEHQETLQLIKIPELDTLEIFSLEETPRIYAVADTDILFLSPFKYSLEMSEFIKYNPITKEKFKYSIRLSFYDVLDLRFDGTYALVKTLGTRDRTHVYNIRRREVVLTGVYAGMYQLQELFLYPLLIYIQHHSFLQLINLQNGNHHRRLLIHGLPMADGRSDGRKPEIGLGNKILLTPNHLILTRYLKYSPDHSDCSCFLEIFSLDDLKSGVLSPSQLLLQPQGPLFSEISVATTGFALLNNQTKTVELFRFWS